MRDAVAHDRDDIDHAVLAAEHALRTGAAVIHDEGGARLAAQQLHLVGEPEAAAMLARAARAFAQPVVAVEHRKRLLHDLDRRRFGDADGRAAVGQPVAAGIAAIAAAGNLVHDVVASARRIVAAEREIAAGAGRRGGDLVRQRLHERREHGLGDALRDLRRAAGNRARIVRVEEGAFRPPDDQRFERAGADRYIRKDVAHGEIDRRQRGRQHAVHRAGAGRAGAGKVEGQRVARLLDRQRDGERPVDHAVGIDESRRTVGAVRDARDIARASVRRRAAGVRRSPRRPFRRRSGRGSGTGGPCRHAVLRPAP